MTDQSSDEKTSNPVEAKSYRLGFHLLTIAVMFHIVWRGYRGEQACDLAVALGVAASATLMIPWRHRPGFSRRAFVAQVAVLAAVAAVLLLLHFLRLHRAGH